MIDLDLALTLEDSGGVTEEARELTEQRMCLGLIKGPIIWTRRAPLDRESEITEDHPIDPLASSLTHPQGERLSLLIRADEITPSAREVNHERSLIRDMRCRVSSNPELTDERPRDHRWQLKRAVIK